MLLNFLLYVQVALAEERKVTEKLSRNLELEKRRVESLEQKAKGTHRLALCYHQDYSQKLAKKWVLGCVNLFKQPEGARL